MRRLRAGHETGERWLQRASMSSVSSGSERAACSDSACARRKAPFRTVFLTDRRLARTSLTHQRQVFGRALSRRLIGS